MFRVRFRAIKRVSCRFFGNFPHFLVNLLDIQLKAKFPTLFWLINGFRLIPVPFEREISHTFSENYVFTIA